MHGWTAVSSPELLALASHKLTGTEYRLLLAVLSVAEFGNLVRCSLADLARLTGMSRQQVSDTLPTLLARGLVDWVHVQRPAPLDPERVLMVSPLLSWRGKAAGHRQAITEWIDHHPELAAA
jgi:DNA-binding MarR family transcriptional regulator